MLAKELAPHAIVIQAIQDRKQTGMPVPPAMLLLAEVHTFRDLMVP